MNKNEMGIPILLNGDKLYHYTSAAGVQGILGKEFWITECHFLNDTSEFQVATEVFLEMLKKHISDETTLERVSSDILAELNRLTRMGKLQEEIAFSGEYVISFCLDEDSILLWSEYSDFMGYCMEFDFQQLYDSFEKVSYHGAVIYDKEKQLEIMEQEFVQEFFEDAHWKELSGWEDISRLVGQEYDNFIQFSSVICEMYNMFFKKACFAGEHEYRFIFSSIHDGGRIRKEEHEKLYFRIKNEVYIPYIKRKVSNLDGLKSVLVGPKNKSDIAVKGLEWFLRNEKLDVAVKKSEMPLRY